MAQASSPDLVSHLSTPTPTPSRPSSPLPGFLKRVSRDYKADVDRMRKAASAALPVLGAIAKVAKEVSSNAGVPGLSEGLSVVSDILEKVQTMSMTIEGIERLNAQLQELSVMLIEFRVSSRGDSLPESMRSRIIRMVGKWVEVGASLSKMKTRHGVVRFFRSEIDATELAGLVAEINCSLQAFLVGGALYTEENVHQIRHNVEEVRDSLELVKRKVDEIASQYNSLVLPRSAKNAQFDANNVRKPCISGTRVQVLDKFRNWVTIACTQTTLLTSQVFWIHGLAGTGKTSIAFSIVEEYKKTGQLAANFFCSRDDPECSDPGMVFPTLASQLCSFFPPLREPVAAVLQNDPAIVDASPARQLEELIVRPLEKVKTSLPVSIVVLDAVDECKDNSGDNPTSIIITAILNFIDRLGSFLFVITSRPDPRITRLFDPTRGKALLNVTTAIDLHSIDSGSVTADISRYLKHDLKESPIPFDVPEGWPTEEDITALTLLAHGLFIFAGTAVRFILDQRYKQPVRRMGRLLGMQPSNPSASGSILDTLYAQVVKEAQIPDIPDAGELEEELKTIVGAITVAAEPLSIAVLAGLLGRPKDEVRNTLSGLCSVLYIPEQDSIPIRFIHPTFREFLLRTSPAKSEAFDIDPVVQHQSLFFKCLDAMQVLEYNILGLENPLLCKNEIQDLTDKVHQHIDARLSYSCRHWGAHLEGASSRMSDEVVVPLRNFLCYRLLPWFEACSWLGVLDGTIYTLDTALRACQSSGEPLSELSNILTDCRRFVFKYSACIDTAPLQLYHSVLAVAPNASFVSQMYATTRKSSLIVQHGAITEWGACIDRFSSTPILPIHAVAFSLDGTFFITAGHDKAIKVWRTTTRTLVLVIKGHSECIKAVAYSPDGTRIVSGGEDCTVRVWDSTSGADVHNLDGSGRVFHVGYSTDGTRILSAASTIGSTIRLWDASSGSCLVSLDPSDAWIKQVDLSPDGTTIVYGTDDSLSLHDVASQAETDLALPEPCRGATFSSDDKYVAASSRTGIWIWSLPDKTLVRKIDVPEDPSRLVFSSNGTEIGCGCADGTVRLWKVKSEGPPKTFPGHVERIQIAWSHDETQVVSVGKDGTIRVWDGTRNTTLQALQTPAPHHDSSGPARVGVFSCGDYISITGLPAPLWDRPQLVDSFPTAEGAPAVATYRNRAVCYYDILDLLGRQHATGDCNCHHHWLFFTGRLYIHSGPPVALSSNGELLAYPSGGPTFADVCVWNLHTRTPVVTLKGHVRRVSSAAFSSDSALLVTGGKDHSVRVWDVASSVLHSRHDSHCADVKDVIFSPDDDLVASGSAKGYVYVSEAKTGHIVRTFVIEGHSGIIAKVLFTLDGEDVVALDHANNTVYIWNIPTDSCVYEFSFGDASWVSALNFSADGSGILVPTGDGDDKRVLPLWDPNERTWPQYHVTKDGWLYAKGPGYTYRLGWLPQEWRYTLCSEDNTFYASDRERWVLVEVDVSEPLREAESAVKQSEAVVRN